MAGNSARQGAVRKANSKKKKPRSIGTGGKNRQALEGRGPTPKAADRVSHPAKRRVDAVARKAEKSAKAGGAKPRPARSKSGGSEVVVGRNPVVEALATHVPATALHIQRFIDSDPRIKQSMAMAMEFGIAVRECSRDELDRLSDGVPHQGIVLSVSPYEYASYADVLAAGRPSQPGLLVALDGITDPRNMGAIARSAAAFGGTGLVIPARRSATVTATAWRASAGALAHVPVAMITNMSRAIEQAQKAGFTAVGLAGDAETSIEGVDLGKDPVMLVIGAEGKGLGRLVAQTCDIRAAIEIDSRIDSLNAAVAAGIALHSIAAGRRLR